MDDMATSIPTVWEDDDLMETPKGSPQIEPQDPQTHLDYERAVAASMEEYDSLKKDDVMEDIQEIHEERPETLSNDFQGRQNSKEITLEMVDDKFSKYALLVSYALDKRFNLPMLNCENADTLIYIDPPPPTRIGDGTEERSYSDEVVVYRMRSADLLATRSPYFDEALGPTKQFRTLRRRKLASSGLPGGIKFVLDLTPPEEGDAAVDLTTELSCSRGIRNWFYAEKRWSIPLESVGGHDDLEEAKIVREVRFLGQCFVKSGLGKDDDGTRKDIKKLIPMDYTAVRHRCAIERVLHIIAGSSPKIDSAPKMWSVFVVAKFLKCSSTITDHIMSWIYNGPNSRFIEVLPEVSLKIADGLQNPMLCRDAFCILVGEEALASAGKDAFGRYGKRRTRRTKEDLDLESFVTRIEYASKAFAERINQTFTELARAHWIIELSEYKEIEALVRGQQNDNTLRLLEEYTEILRGYVQGRIRTMLLQERDYDSEERLNTILDHDGADLLSYESYRTLYSNMLPRESLLTRSFWYQILGMDVATPPATSRLLYSRRRNPPEAEAIDTVSWRKMLEETEALNKTVYETTMGFSSGEGVGCLWMKSSSSVGTAPRQSTNELPIRTKDSLLATKRSDDSVLTGLIPPPATPLRQDIKTGLLLTGNAEERARRLHDFTALWGSQQGGEPSTNPSSRPFSYRYPEIQSSLDRYIKCVTNIYKRTSKPVDAGREESIYDGSTLADSPTLPAQDGDLPRPGELFRLSHSNYGPDFQDIPFNVHRFLRECTSRIASVAHKMIQSSLHFDPALTDTLYCLDENEFQFLPLYAGGNDDESGGVFEQELPNAVGGPIGPGPKYHVSNSSAASSEFEMVSAEGSVSLDTSLAVEDGWSDCLDRRRVYSEDELSGKLDIKGKGKQKAVDEDVDDWLHDFEFAGKGKWKGRAIDGYGDHEIEDAAVVEHGSDEEEYDEDEFFETDDDIISVD